MLTITIKANVPAADAQGIKERTETPPAREGLLVEALRARCGRISHISKALSANCAAPHRVAILFRQMMTGTSITLSTVTRRCRRQQPLKNV